MWNEERFKVWKERPETKEFLAFLHDRRDELMAAWADGQELTPHHQAMAQVFGDIIELNYEETVVPFYEPEEKEDDGVQE